MQCIKSCLVFFILFVNSPEKNVMEFDGEDVCGASTWESMFVDPPDKDDKKNIVNVLVVGLRPYTQYAFLVRSYTISSTNYGAKSDIIYTQTLEDRKCMD